MSSFLRPTWISALQSFFVLKYQLSICVINSKYYHHVDDVVVYHYFRFLVLEYILPARPNLEMFPNEAGGNHEFILSIDGICISNIHHQL